MVKEDPDSKGATAFSITLDKRINIVSLANLGALIALLLTAVSTWYGLVSKVEGLNARIDAAASELSHIRADVQTSMVARDADIRSLRDKTEAIGNRLSVVEVQLNTAATAMGRIERKLDGPVPPRP